MKYKIPCTNDLYIDDNYFIYNLSGELIFNTAEVFIDIQNTSKTLVSEWLYLYARHQFPESINVDHIQFYRLPDFRDNFPWRAKFTKPYYYDREHRIVPMCPNLAISKNGHMRVREFTVM